MTIKSSSFVVKGNATETSTTILWVKDKILPTRNP